MQDIEIIKKDLKKTLTKLRYEHSLKVADEAKKLAKHYNYDDEKAYLAGLTHDIAKDLTEEENYNLVKKYHLPQQLLNTENTNLKHADIGAFLAKEKYHLENDICKAIKYHTIGNKDMDLLAKIVFIADKIARDNLPEGLKEVKKLAYQEDNIDIALKYCLVCQENHLKAKGINIHPETKKLLDIL